MLSRATLTIALSLALLTTARAQTPQITAFVGTGSQTSFMTLDFKDGVSNPVTYAFGYRYDGAKNSGDFLLALASGVPTFGATLQGSIGVGLGRYVEGLSYGGRNKFNDFGGGNSGDPNGFWSLWTSSNGFTGWSESQVGIDGRALTSGSWDGWSWTADFNNPSAPPQTPVAAPEPSALALLGLGVPGFFVIRRRYNPS